MTRITNSKVRSLGPPPQWAAFPGYSLLFDQDDPAANCSRRADGLLQIACDIHDSSAVLLYRRLDHGLRALDPRMPGADAGFAPLPAPSYHVTFIDGLNVANRHEVHPPLQPQLEAALADVPAALCGPGPLVSACPAPPLDRPLHFCFDRLRVRYRRALVACLKPHPDCVGQFEALRRRRAALGRQCRKCWGTSAAGSYQPHVSLGYFARERDARAAETNAGAWTSALERDLTLDVTIRFASISLYGFTDMATFFKSPDSRRQRSMRPDSA